MDTVGTQGNFSSEVLEFPGQVLVDFWASWCGPCQMLSPIIEEIGQEFKDLKVVKVDVDSEPELATKYNVSSIPTVIIFKGGQIVETVVGFRQKSDYLAILKK